jgi:hypothetical protein
MLPLIGYGSSHSTGRRADTHCRLVGSRGHHVRIFIWDPTVPRRDSGKGIRKHTFGTNRVARRLGRLLRRGQGFHAQTYGHQPRDTVRRQRGG